MTKKIAVPTCEACINRRSAFLTALSPAKGHCTLCRKQTSTRPAEFLADHQTVWTNYPHTGSPPTLLDECWQIFKPLGYQSAAA